MATACGELTEVLQSVGRGDDSARVRLLSLIYDELHRMAASQMRGERIDHTLQPTALVNEMYLRLLEGGPAEWDNRGHFFASAAEVMRRILVDYARARGAEKRGGRAERVALADSELATDTDPGMLLDIDEALRNFEAVEPEKAQLVKLRFFTGLNLDEIAEMTGISVRTAKRHWRYARAWLYQRISADPQSEIAPSVGSDTRTDPAMS